MITANTPYVAIYNADCAQKNSNQKEIILNTTTRRIWSPPMWTRCCRNESRRKFNDNALHLDSKIRKKNKLFANFNTLFVQRCDLT